MKVTSIWEPFTLRLNICIIQFILKDKERDQDNWIISNVFLSVIVYLNINKDKKNTIRASQLLVPIMTSINNWKHNNNFLQLSTY